MKSIKKKISIPFISIIIIIPVVTMIIFNFAIKIYINKITRSELVNTVNGTEMLINTLITTELLDRGDARDITAVGQKLMLLRKASSVSRLSLNTELIIISNTGDVLFPRTFEDTFLRQDIVTRAKELIGSVRENSVAEFNVGKDRFMAVYKTINRNFYMFFISSANSGKEITRILNLSLLIILFAATSLGVIIASMVANSISKPITRISKYAKQIGSGDFIYLPDDESSQEIYELTKSMNDMSARLKNLDNAQKSFLQNASHELRTPLMSIQGYAEGIVNDVFKDTTRAASIILEESKRLNNLVDELLTLSRIDSKSYKSEFISVNLSDEIKEIIQRVEGYAVKEGKRLNLEISCDDLNVRIDENLLMQAVSNIVSNCVRYAKTKVDISVFRKENNAVIRISDDGAGINDIEISRIFERFYKGKQGNSGLGLSIAKSAVEHMGGKISAYNNNGAVFEIELPLI